MSSSAEIGTSCLPAVDETLAKLAWATVLPRMPRLDSGRYPCIQKQSHWSHLSLLSGDTAMQDCCSGFIQLPNTLKGGKHKCWQGKGREGTVCHADDILVFGSTRERHDHRPQMLEQLQEEGPTLNNDKCQFTFVRIMIPGHIRSAKGIDADPGKIKAITEMPTLKDANKVNRVLGMVNWKVLSTHCRVHTTTTGDAQVKHWLGVGERTGESIQWTAADASCFGLGGVLSQKQPFQEWWPVLFISHSMTDTEWRYANHSRCALQRTCPGHIHSQRHAAGKGCICIY